MVEFSKQEDRFFDELQGRFVLFGNPQRAGSKSTYWMQMNVLNGTDIAGGRTPESTTMSRALEMVLEKIDAQEFVIYQKKEDLDAAIAQNDKKKGGAQEADDSLTDDKLEQREDDVDHLRQERAFFHDERPLDVGQFVVDEEVAEHRTAVDSAVGANGADHVDVQEDLGQSRSAVRGDDVALDVFEKFAHRNDEVAVTTQQNQEVEPKSEVKVDLEVEKEPELEIELEPEPAPAPMPTPEPMPEPEPEKETEAKDLFEQFGAEEDTSAYTPPKEKKVRHVVPHVETKQSEQPEQPEQSERHTTHKAKVPQTDMQAAEMTQVQNTQRKKHSTAMNPEVPLLEAVARFWHEAAHARVTDADAFIMDMNTFGDVYFSHFIDTKKRVMYAWQALRSDAPESFQMSILFTQFNKKYGEEALIAYISTLPDKA